MKKVKFLLTLLTLGILAAWTCNVALAATATGSFNYDFTTDPPCAGVVTTNCVDHFEVWDVTSTPGTKLSSVPLPTNPSAAPITFSFKVGPPYGTRTWSAGAVARDGTMSDLTKSTATVITRPGAPAAFVVTLQ